MNNDNNKTPTCFQNINTKVFDSFQILNLKNKKLKAKLQHARRRTHSYTLKREQRRVNIQIEQMEQIGT
jgi:hypothetical protein